MPLEGEGRKEGQREGKEGQGEGKEGLAKACHIFRVGCLIAMTNERIVAIQEPVGCIYALREDK